MGDTDLLVEFLQIAHAAAVDCEDGVSDLKKEKKLFFDICMPLNPKNLLVDVRMLESLLALR